MKRYEIEYRQLDYKTFKCNAQSVKGAERQWKKFAKENYIHEFAGEGTVSEWVEKEKK